MKNTVTFEHDKEIEMWQVLNRRHWPERSVFGYWETCSAAAVFNVVGLKVILGKPWLVGTCLEDFSLYHGKNSCGLVDSEILSRLPISSPNAKCIEKLELSEVSLGPLARFGERKFSYSIQEQSSCADQVFAHVRRARNGKYSLSYRGGLSAEINFVAELKTPDDWSALYNSALTVDSYVSTVSLHERRVREDRAIQAKSECLSSKPSKNRFFQMAHAASQLMHLNERSN